MSGWSGVVLDFDAWVTHVASVSLVALRLSPLTFLCPLFGGPWLPPTVRGSLVLVLALFFHVGAGLTASVQASISGWDWLTSALREALFGVVIGVVAAVPWNLARMGGRFIDIFRGSSAEVVLPGIGSREAVSGELLHHGLVVACASSWGYPLLLSGLTATFTRVRIGVPVAPEAWVYKTFELAGTAMAMGLVISAPFIATAFAVDCALELLGRVAPALNLVGLGTPVKVLGGGALLWGTLSVLANALLHQASAFPHLLQAFLERLP